jgi:hypothetical protein
MPKVIVRIKGGMGNQLFCYAAARRLALANHAELVIDDVTGFARDRLYNRRYALDNFRIPVRKATPAERMEPCERIRRGIAKFISRRRPFHRRNYVEQEGVDFDLRLLEMRLPGTLYLDGLWQSEAYFKDIESTIRQDLRFSASENYINRETMERIMGCNSVAVHVRWFESRSEGNSRSHNLGQHYYASAIREIQRRAVDPHYFLFSDDPEAARSVLPLPEKMITCVCHNGSPESACADLQLMSACRNFITANSIFSWWGAWLGNRKEKIVICPSALSSTVEWDFRGQIPDGWLKI